MYKAFVPKLSGLFRSTFPANSATHRQIQTLVSTEWLSEKIVGNKTANIRVVHAMVKSDEFTSHIPGASCFDTSICLNSESAYPNMLPTADQFQTYVNKLYVSNDDHVIVYDANPDYPSLMPGARVWFMFKYFGHERVSLLNGGFFKWVNEGRQISKQFSASPSNKKPFKANLRPNLIVTFEDVLKNVETNNSQLIDARHAAGFKGSPGGHIPKSVNIPFSELVDINTKLVHEEVHIRALFEKSKINLFKPTIASCNSGMVACSLVLAQHMVGKYDAKLYDGSWSEWSKRADEKMIVKN